MIKTQTNEENRFMKRILPHYYRYVTENPHTFLVRIYGMHRVKMYHLNRKVHFVIMGSVFDTPCQINTIYDLKGSLVGRSATPEERASGGVLKDNDLILDGNKLKLGSKRDLFINQLEKDATFLSQLNIMDYSLLVCEPSPPSPSVSLGGNPSPLWQIFPRNQTRSLDNHRREPCRWLSPALQHAFPSERSQQLQPTSATCGG
jgi:hypothetical protein